MAFLMPLHMDYLIETTRLGLREFSLEDAESMYSLNLDQEVLKFTGDIPFKSVIEAKEFLANYSDYKRNGFGRWTVVLKETHEAIGWCGLKRHDEGFVDIGFRFLKKEWNKGFATESAQACLKYGFEELGLSEIIGRVATENIGSIKVLEKLEMSYWKKAPCDGIDDALYYRIINEKKD
jgi:RimJ/RimL family protein N-acetyltransferase